MPPPMPALAPMAFRMLAKMDGLPPVTHEAIQWRRQSKHNYNNHNNTNSTQQRNPVNPELVTNQAEGMN
jgi:hypothetical protein